MPRRSNKNIAEDELLIMKQLATNANESIDKIAKSCGFSRQKVWRIVKRLEAEKSIWGYTVAAEDKKLGVNTFIALAKSKGPPLNIEGAIKAITTEKLPEKLGITLLDAHYMNGVYDWILIFAAKNINEAKKVSNLIQKEFENIERIDLLESIFPLVKCHTVNPNLSQLKEFIVK